MVSRWLDRILLLTKLRMRMRVRVFRRDFVKLCAVECSADEAAQVEAISTQEIAQLGRGMEFYLETKRVIPPLYVLCLGQEARLDKMPAAVKRWTADPFGGGVWLRELRTGIALFEDGNPIRRIVVHELTHALLDVLTDGFAYPLTVVEGFARRAEWLLPDCDGVIPWKEHSAGLGASGGGCVDEHHYMSIRDLLFFDPKRYWRKDMQAFFRMTELSFWLNCYLFGLSDERSSLPRILAILRQKNVRTSEGVHLWLQEVTGMGEQELESHFHSFCTTGVIPLLSS